ncbi:hypothetical protein ACQEVG_33045 [Streptomyces sp. CA-135486]|uniref:hypothetical protein n=1 Tax=Streptomyces sp. CA-135486 TaxID=3240049 RepID=UPI003D8A91FA
MAYTSTGEFGNTAVVGYVPFFEIPDVSLMDMANRHHPQRLWSGGAGAPQGFPEACWLICTATGGRLTRRPGTLDLHDAAWTLEVDSTVDLGRTMYAHERLVAGRLRFQDPELMERAKGILQSEDFAAMDASDMPAHTAG